MDAAHELLLGATFELGEQRTEEVVGVEHNNGTEKQAELFPSDHLEEFFESAHPAGTGYAGIGHLGHALFATVHVGGDNELGHAGVFPMLFDHELRYDAHGATAGGENAVDGRAHEPGAAGAVDERVSVGGQAMSQLMGGLPIALRNLTRGGGVDCDVHEGRERLNVITAIRTHDGCRPRGQVFPR